VHEEFAHVPLQHSEYAMQAIPPGLHAGVPVLVLLVVDEPPLLVPPKIAGVLPHAPSRQTSNGIAARIRAKVFIFRRRLAPLATLGAVIDPSLTMRAPTLLAVLAAGCASPAPSVATPVVETTAAPGVPQAPDAGEATPPARRSLIAAGDHHTCQLTAGGGIVCWGYNRYGQLGDGSRDARPAPVRISLADVIDVAAGEFRTCAVTTPGLVYCWGGLSERRLVPTLVAGVANAAAVAVGDEHMCALLRNGDVSCWGNNTKGQLGDGATTSRDEPAKVPGVTGAIDVAAGPEASCALLRSGKVLCWGSDGARRALSPLEVAGLPAMRSVRMHGGQACGVAADGRVFCWGEHVMKFDAAKSPEPIAVGDWTGVVDLAVGNAHRCVLLADGSLSCMGAGGGAGRADWQYKPIVVRAPGYLQAKGGAASAGDGFTCVLDAAGAAQCLGWNGEGELGIGEMASFVAPPGEVPGVDDAVRVVPAFWAACALRKDGTVVCWGSGESPATRPALNPRPHATPAEAVPGLPVARTLFPGPDGSSLCAGTASGDVYCFRAGLVGPGRTARRVVGLRDVVDIAPWPHRDGIAYAVLRSGTVVAFQAKAKHADDKTIEVVTAPLAGLSNVVEMIADSADACARKKDGTVACVALAEPFDPSGRPLAHAPPARVEVVKDLAGVVDLGFGHPWAARTRGGDVFFIEDRATGYRATEQPRLRGATAMSHLGDFLAIMSDGVLVSTSDRYGSGGGANGVWDVYKRDDLGPAIAVEKISTGCVVRPTGKVACWGNNLGGACGSNHRVFSSEPLSVKLPSAP
jgi:alpha-tubulin suppressor-like RCC1 family protein